MQPRHKETKLKAFTQLSYALPQASVAMLFNPIFVIQGIYIKYYGFAMSTMATILLLSRIVDAITDPLVGTLSDWRKAHHGKRKNLVITGILLFMVAGFFIYMPSQQPSVIYFTIWLFVFYLGFTLYSIPHMIWGGEIAKHSTDKKRIFAYYTAAGYTGLVMFYGLPLLPWFETTEITPDTLRTSCIVGAVIMVPALFFCVRFVPEKPLTSTHQRTGNKIKAIREAVSVISTNKPFLVFLCAFFSTAMGLVIWYSMIFIYVDIYLNVGALYSPLYLASFAIGVGVSFAAARLGALFGAKLVWQISIVIGLISVALTSQLSPTNAGPGALFAVLLGTTIAFVTTYVLGRAILAEIVDYSTLKSGKNLGATYFSVWIFCEKIILAIGGAIGLGLAAYLGFNPEAQTQSTDGVFALSVVMSWLPGSFLIAALVFVGVIPMNERRHEIVRKRLAQREQRLSNRSNVKAKSA